MAPLRRILETQGGGALVEIAEPIVGRAVELDAFDRVLAELPHGRPALIELAGEPGIGKTRLLGELARRADALGCLVLAGSAAELERDLPFSVFVDALDEYVESLGAQELGRLPDEIQSELATVFPSLSGLAIGRGVAVQHERFRSHRAVRELLELLAETQPLVLVLDDLHWSDPGSIELLSALLRRPPAACVLLTFALRPRQIPERLAPALERAERAGVLVRMELAALTRAEAHELLRADDHARLADLYGESGGNPFYLQQLARAEKRSRGMAAQGIALEGVVDVPPAVAAALGEELSLLSPQARTALEGAAVAGDPFEPELAAAAADVTEPALLVQLDELLGLDLIRPTEMPRRFRFRHPLLRRAVYESTPGGWRIGSHERCASALADRGAPPTTRAHHVEWSAHHGDADAVATLREAGEAAQRRTPESAARWFAAALRLLPSTNSRTERFELLLARAGALAAAGHFADSHAALVDAMAVIPPGAESMRARLTARCARLEHLLLRRVEARSRLESALAECHDGDSPEAAALMLALAVESYYDMNPAAMYSWASRALDATQLAPPGLRAEALALRADAAVLGGRSDAGTCLDEAEVFVDSRDDGELELHLDALAHLGTAEFYFPRYAASVEHVERALAIGRAAGQGDLFPSLYPVLASSLARQGRLAEAIDVADTALEAARLLGNTHQIAWGLINRSYTALAAGDLELAIVTSQEAQELAKQLDGRLVTVAAGHASARVLVETGNGSAAAELLLQVAGGPSLIRQPLVSRVPSFLTLARSFVSAGRIADAEEAARGAAACAEQIGLPLAAATSEVTAAHVAFAVGDCTRAAELALSAIAKYSELGDVYGATAVRVLAGRALAQADQPELAVAELERAAATFELWGAARYRDEAERELRKLGRHIHRRTRPGDAEDGVASLTRRELDVARLVSEGKSNPEIAAELFLSPKTVESHIRNMFQKLGVTSRVEIAVAVRAVEASSPATK